MSALQSPKFSGERPIIGAEAVAPRASNRTSRRDSAPDTGWSTRKESAQPSEGWLGKPLASPVGGAQPIAVPRPGESEGSRGETTLLKELVLRALVAIQGIDARVRDEDGQTLAEYGLIMAVIAVAVVIAAVVAFRGAIVSAFNQATDCLDGSC